MSPIEVADFGSNAPENLEYVVLAIGKSEIRLKIFEAVYYHKAEWKSASDIAQKTGIAREKLIKDIRPLVNRKVVRQKNEDGEIYYGMRSDIKSHKKEIIDAVNNPKKIETLPTKRRPQVIIKNQIEVRDVRIPTKAFNVRRITADDIENFTLIQGIAGDNNLPKDLSETAFKNGIQAVIGEPGNFKDWGGEKSDLFTTRLRINGKNLAAAFAFKGPGVPGKLTIKKMGVNADQGPRLFQEPADVFIVQHWREIDPQVIELIEVFAIAKSVTTGKKIWYGIIDGKDSDRIRRAYPDKFPA